MVGEHVLIGTDAGLFDLARAVAFADREVSHLDDGWAVVDGQLHRRGPDGWSVETLAVDAEANCVAALGADEALVGTREAHLVLVTGGRAEPVTSFEDAPTREDWYTPWGGPPDVRSLAIGADGTWYVNVHVGGILRSTGDGSDGPGERWADTIDLDTDVHQVVAVDGLLLAALGIGGLGISRDDGATWSLHDDGLHASYCRAVAVAGDTILLSASSGPYGDDAAIYRRPLADDEAPFERCVDGLPERFDDNVDTHCLAAVGDVAVLGAPSGHVYRSEDAGRSWTEVAAGLPPARCVHLVRG